VRELERAQARDRVRARESRDSAGRLRIDGIKGMRMPKQVCLVFQFLTSKHRGLLAAPELKPGGTAAAAGRCCWPDDTQTWQLRDESKPRQRSTLLQATAAPNRPISPECIVD